MSSGMNSGNDKKAPPNRLRYAVPMLLVALGAVAYGIYWLAVARGTVYTDDAQIQALLIPCGSRVGGRVAEILVWEGAKVSKGQVLARLDEMPFRAQADEARAAVDAAKAQVEAARLNLQKARTVLPKEIAIAAAEVRAAEAKEKLNRKDRERFDHLQGIAADEALDQARTAWDGSDAALSVAREKLGFLSAAGTAGGDTALPPRVLDIMVLENQYEMAKANLGLAQARLDLAENNLAEIEVKALADGQISRRHAEPGQVVAPGQKIFTITAASPIWVEANFEEDDVAALKPGDAASIKVDAYPGRVFSGHVAGVLPASLSQFSLLSAGASSGNFIKVTQRVPVRLILDAHDLPPLYPGLNVEVRVRIGTAPSPPQAK